MSNDLPLSTTADKHTDVADVARSSDTRVAAFASDDDVPECRICRESTGTLMSATCRCNTVVHMACLRRWQGYRADALFPLLSSTTRNMCEICRHPVNLSKGNHTNHDTTAGQSSSSPASISSLLWANYEACCLLPRAISTCVNRMCEDAFTVESCLFTFLVVLAVMGHALFVLSVYKGAEKKDEHSLKRMCLAIANAVVTLSLLIVVQKLASRWLREMEAGETIVDIPRSVATLPTVANGRPDINDDSTAHQQQQQAAADIEAQVREYRAYTTRCTTFSQVLLGAFLSVIAAAEIFFLVRELPLGGLA